MKFVLNTKIKSRHKKLDERFNGFEEKDTIEIKYKESPLHAPVFETGKNT